MPAVRRFGFVLLSTVLLSACGRQAEQDAARRASAELQQTLARSAPRFITAHHDGARLWKTIRAFYKDRRYEPAWIDGTRPRRQLDALLGALDGADRHGLDPALYDLGPLADARSQVQKRLLAPDGFDPSLVAPIDLRLTAAWLSYASDLATGVTDRPHADPMWRVKPQPIDLGPLLTQALADDRVEEALHELAPPHEEYRHLMDAHQRYRDIQKNGGWKALPARLSLKPGQRSPHLAALAARLAATGDLETAVAQSPPATYNAELQHAVRAFALRHHLPDTPVLTRAVVAELNVPVEARLQQIEVNMERWRWFPRDLGERHIRVNVPAYHLEVRDSGAVALSMKVIVGAKDNATPIFSDTMTMIVFSPYWNVPAGIAAEETLPAVLNDPEFLARNNIEVVATSGEVVDPRSIDWESWAEAPANGGDGEEGTVVEVAQEFPYRFRQRPGTTNSLGLVKFLFPNAFDVYLHDTPATALFDERFRALSHGCIRIHKPVELAEYLLNGVDAWGRERIVKAMQAGDETFVKLPAPIRVHLMYWTAVADADGSVSFFDDIYGHDERQWKVYRARIERVKQKKAALPQQAERWIKRPSNAGGGNPGTRKPGGGASPRRGAPRAGKASR
jgi:murein L,D-transpeptidase YcbB/YkuD